MKKADKRVKNYEFCYSDKIGSGAYAQVYAAQDLLTNQTVALKIIQNSILQSDYSKKCLTQEVEMMKRLSHPNIVRLIDVFHSINNSYIVTELCNGGDLREYLKKSQLSEQQALGIFRQILQGVQELLRNGVVHRDIKPANILIHDGLFKITDFGFARQAPDEQMMTSLVGTPLYMSPQILTQQLYTSKTDIWSLGLILYEMIHRSTPWKANGLIELIGKIQTQPIYCSPQISQSTQQLIRDCLEIQEEKRISWESLFELIKQPQNNLFKLIRNPRLITSNTNTLVTQRDQREQKLQYCKTQSVLQSPIKRTLSTQTLRSEQIRPTADLIKKKKPFYDILRLLKEVSNKKELNDLLDLHKQKIVISQVETVFTKTDETNIIKQIKAVMAETSNTQTQILLAILSVYRKVVYKNIKQQTLSLSSDEIKEISNCHVLQKKLLG